MKRLNFATLLILSLILAPLPTSANDVLSGTLHTTFNPMKSKGQLVGCSLVYTHLVVDNIYKRGRILSLIGNVTFMASMEKTNAGISFKIGVNEAVNGNTTTLPAENFYIESNGKVIKPQAVIDADTPGYKMLVFNLETSKDVLEAILENKLSVGFNFDGGMLDINTPLDFTVTSFNIHDDATVQRQHSNISIQEFSDCNAKVIENLLAASKSSKNATDKK